MYQYSADERRKKLMELNDILYLIGKLKMVNRRGQMCCDGGDLMKITGKFPEEKIKFA